MFQFRNAAVALVAGAAIFASAAPSIAADSPKTDASAPAAMARFSKAVSYTGAPKLVTTVDMITAGGGPTAFDTTKLVGVLAGSLTSAELASLTKQFGADNVTSFVKTFNFVVNDAVKQVVAAKVPLPAADADAKDGKALSGDLYKLGVTPTGAFDVEYMLDQLVTHPIHVQVMNDIDADKTMGPKADANYHAVLTQAMTDLKAAYKL